MTYFRKSDAQLDAEAEGREVAESVSARSLVDAITLHRQLSAAELFLPRLHVHDGESGLGPPFSPAFERFLDAFYGASFPWSAGVKSLRNDCRRSHSEHWSNPVWYGSLCSRLVHLIIREGWSYGRACYELGVDQERTERTLLRAFRRIEQRLDEIQSRETEAVKSSEGRHDWQAAPHVHVGLPGLHAAECVQCLRRAAA